MLANVQLRDKQLAKMCKVAGIDTDDALAQRMNVSPATVSRVRRGTAAPGSRFIGGLLEAFPDLEFSDLFEVVSDTLEDAA